MCTAYGSSPLHSSQPWTLSLPSSTSSVILIVRHACWHLHDEVR
jgi:hypothetical protein